MVQVPCSWMTDIDGQGGGQMEEPHEACVWSRAKAERNRGEDVWIASDGQKENHQVKCGNEGE